MGYSRFTDKLMPAHTGNYTAGRQQAVSEITIHHTGSVITLEQLGLLWQTQGRQGSSHYGVKDGLIYCYVSEGDTAWTNSNWPSNCRAITIETANSHAGGDWPVSDKSVETLIKLVADIAARNNLGSLKVGENLTYHSMYTATVCPGPYLRSKLQYIADRANEINRLWLPCDKLLTVTGTRCEFFHSADVNDIAGKLPKGEVYTVTAQSKEKINGFYWVKIRKPEAEYFVALLDDRCVVTHPQPQCENCAALNREIAGLREENKKLGGILDVIKELTEERI